MAAAPAPVRRLKTRKQFLQAARGKRAGRSAFSLQVTPADGPLPGVGFTVTKKIGNAPARNRIKRRLREIVRAEALALRGGHDYVLVARRDALTLPFGTMAKDLRALADKLATSRGRPEDAPRRGDTEEK